MNKWRFQIVLVIVSALMFADCANIVSPTGGVKDTTPPQIVFSEPPNFSTLFFDNKVEIEFDEYVKLQDLKNQLIVSPPMIPEPEVKLKGKKLTIELSDSLEFNTTFVISFGDAIVDVNEGNALKNYKYVFSTGNYLDSLAIKGSLKNAFTLAGVSDALVMLYEDLADSVPMLVKPTYFSKTDGAGNFAINYLRKSKYKLFALQDKNNNYLYDLPDEEIAFLEGPVVADKNSKDQKLELNMFLEDNEQQYVATSSYTAPGKIQLIMNKPYTNPKVELLDSDDEWIWEISADGDSINYWSTAEVAPSKIRLVVSDSTIADTLSLSLDKKNDIDTLIKPRVEHLKLDLGEPLRISFEDPITNFEPKQFQLMVDSAPSEFLVRKRKWNHRAMYLDVKWQEGKEYTLTMLPGAVESVFGIGNDTSTTKFTTKKADFYGSLSLDLTLDEPGKGYLLQLYNSKGRQVSERLVNASGIQSYQQLRPDTYVFKIIKDRNGNKRWDVGDYMMGKQAESVKVTKEKIEIRSNWEMDLEWDLTE